MNSETSIVEARRYIDNAKDLLREKARKEDGYYQDRKYVKMAGHTAYTGVLLALDDLLGKKTKGRKDVDWYKERIAKMDKKVLNTFISMYETLHLHMGYDGTPNSKISAIALEEAESIIDWVATRQAA
jgi:hypothetical protein